MSAYTVISGVTRTVGDFLNARTGVEVDYDRSPDEAFPANRALIHVYLYRVEQSPFFANNEWVRETDTRLRQPPQGVKCFYLITPFGRGQTQIQVTLGEILKVFHETPIIPPESFDATLQDTTEELRIVPHPLSLPEMTELWRAFNERSYRLSLTYEASVALIDSELARDVARRVEERHVAVRPMR